MFIQYQNRKGQIYYLHKKLTKNGNQSFFFSLKKDGDLVDALPEGFEIYENPNAQVFLRRTQPRLITDEELKLIKKELEICGIVKDYLVNLEKNVIVVYLADQDRDRLSEILTSEPKDKFSEMLKQCLTYSPMLKFVLKEKDERLFQTQRYCFLGSIDDWIDIGHMDRLGSLAKKYVRHLGEDSYFELF